MYPKGLSITAWHSSGSVQKKDLVPMAKHWQKTELSTNRDPLYYAASGPGE